MEILYPLSTSQRLACEKRPPDVVCDLFHNAPETVLHVLRDYPSNLKTYG